MSRGYNKESLMEMGLNHWEEYLPEKFQRLVDAETLKQELAAAADITLQAMVRDMEAGFTQEQAWEVERECHLLLRPESDEDFEQTPRNIAWN